MQTDTRSVRWNPLPHWRQILPEQQFRTKTAAETIAAYEEHHSPGYTLAQWIAALSYGPDAWIDYERLASQIREEASKPTPSSKDIANILLAKGYQRVVDDQDFLFNKRIDNNGAFTAFINNSTLNLLRITLDVGRDLPHCEIKVAYLVYPDTPSVTDLENHLLDIYRRLQAAPGGDA